MIVSLLTPPEPDSNLASFFERLQTSSDDDASAASHPLLLVNLLHLRRAAAGHGWRAYRDDLGGFALGWALVITLVVVTGWWLGR